MSDLNWCTFCDTAISHYSESLYCSEDCLRADALRNHPLLGYDWHEFTNFPRPYPRNHHYRQQQQQQQHSTSNPLLSPTPSSISLEDNPPSLSTSSSPILTVSWKSSSELSSLRTSNNSGAITAVSALPSTQLGLSMTNTIKHRHHQQQPLPSQLSLLIQSSNTLR